MKKLILTTAITMFVTMLIPTISTAQKATTPVADDMECKKPQYSPRKEQHRNCKDFLGRRQGIWKSYTYYGYMISEITYKDNKINGPVTIYFAAIGKVREKSNYFDGRKDGDYSSYFFSGATASEGEYDYGKKIGLWNYYYASTGETRMAGNYKAGKREGDWKFYNSKGLMTKVVEYKDGEVIKTTTPQKQTLADNASN